MPQVDPFAPIRQQFGQTQNMLTQMGQMKQQKEQLAATQQRNELLNQQTQIKQAAQAKTQEQEVGFRQVFADAQAKGGNPYQASLEYLAQQDPMEAMKYTNKLVETIGDAAKLSPTYAKQLASTMLGIDDLQIEGQEITISYPEVGKMSGSIDAVVNMARWHNQNLDAEPQQLGMKAAEFGISLEAAEQEPPERTTMLSGTEQLTQEFDPATGQYKTIAQAPRWQPDKPEKLSARDKKIEQYTAMGLSPDEAMKVVDGMYRIGKNDQGWSTIFDMTTQQPVRRLDAKAGAQAIKAQGQEAAESVSAGAPSADETFLTPEALELGTGPGSYMRQALNNVLGPLVPGQPAPKTEAARNQLRLFTQVIKPYLMVSDRGAVYEQRNIENLLPNPNNFFVDPDGEKDKIVNVRKLVESSIKGKQRLLDTGKLSKKTSDELQDDIVQLQVSLSFIPPIESLRESTRAFNTMTAAQLKAIDPASLSESEQKKYLERVKQIKRQRQ
jgi:hypothetical protein